ncbi:MAG: rhodanese-like domain-containing protein [Candidatus Bipolaricaulia bacterium]
MRHNLKTHRHLIILIAAVLSVGLAVGVTSAQTPYQSLLMSVLDGLKADTPWGFVDVTGAFDLWGAEAAFFVDVRSSEDYEAGHIPGATLLTLETLPENLDKLPEDMDTLIVTYCKSGWRASLGVMTLRLLGYVNAKGFDGGWVAWTEAGHPTTEGSTP